MSAFVPTPEQAGAIHHPLEDACVMAGAGSGKTAVLTRRYLEHVTTHGLQVRRVAALTYTEKAAGEMRARIAKTLAETGRRDLAEEVEFASISTVHAFCARLLRRRAVEAGVDPAFRVLAEPEGGLLRQDCLTLALNELAAAGSNAPSVLARISLEPRGLLPLLATLRGAGAEVGDLRAARGLGEASVADVEEAVAALESAAQAEEDVTRERTDVVVHAFREALGGEVWALLRAHDLIRSAKPDGTKRGKRAFTSAKKALEVAATALSGSLLDDRIEQEILPDVRTLLQAYERIYTRRKHEDGVLDFTDLERLALDLLERESDLELGLDALLVDELQDTNPLQARILARLRASGCPMFGVGDPKQSIYRFRRADVRVIQAEWDRLDEEGRHYLDATFRARPALVDVLNALTGRLFQGDAAGVECIPLRAARETSPIDGPDAELVIVDVGPDADADIRREAEARWIAARIRRLVDANAHEPGDIAILLKARSNLEAYEAALRDARIPFQTDKGRGYFQADEVVDLIMALRVVHDPADDHALACLLTGPAFSATDDLLIDVFCEREAWAHLKEREDAASLVATIETLRSDAGDGRLGRVVEGVLRRLGLLDVALLADANGRRALNLRKAVQVARRLETDGGYDLGDLLLHLETLHDLEVPEGEAVSFEGAGNAVKLLTVHGSKGLEFPVVFLADVGRPPVGSKASFRFDPDVGLALKLRHPLEGTEARPGGWTRLDDEDKARAAEEGLRLLYVAMTRAEERLIMTASAAGLTGKGKSWCRVSGWGKQLVEALGTLPGPEAETVELGEGRLLVQAVSAPDPIVAPRVEPAADEPVPKADVERLLARADEAVAPLGLTPYVVTVSELCRFAGSPAAFYASRLEPQVAPPEREVAHDLDDEIHDPGSSIDRGALGRMLHRALERHASGSMLASIVEEETGERADPQTLARLSEMVGRFETTATAARIDEDADVRRELRFHVRVRFPAGETVGGFEHLLVRGAIDLWLPGDRGVEIVDYKTNAPSPRLESPDDVAALYTWQMKLYALAAERMTGEDVGAARLILLDPGWGETVPELEIDVSGDALKEARRLCRAFAVASLENRWPTTWEALLR